MLYNLSRFLLARHKAALEVYNEAAKLSTKDWVCCVIFIYTVFNDQCAKFASTMYVSDFQYLITEQIAQYFIPCNSVQYVHIMIKKKVYRYYMLG